MRVAVTWSPQHLDTCLEARCCFTAISFPHSFRIRPAIRAPCRGGRAYHRLNNFYIDRERTQNKIIKASLAHYVFSLKDQQG